MENESEIRIMRASSFACEKVGDIYANDKDITSRYLGWTEMRQFGILEFETENDAIAFINSENDIGNHGLTIDANQTSVKLDRVVRVPKFVNLDVKDFTSVRVFGLEEEKENMVPFFYNK
jgi:hypothetical protein